MGYDKILGGGGENVTAEVNAQTPIIQQITESLVGKIEGANATPDKILEGYSAYVGQELVVGNIPLSKMKIDYGIVKVGATKSFTVRHSLKSVPSLVTLIPIVIPSPRPSYSQYLIVDGVNVDFLGNKYYGVVYGSSSDGNVYSKEQRCTTTNGEVVFKTGSSEYNFAAGTYLWLSIA